MVSIISTYPAECFALKIDAAETDYAEMDYKASYTDLGQCTYFYRTNNKLSINYDSHTGVVITDTDPNS
ncbi:MAG: hypothetical protein ACRC6S_03305 [Shewanella sp.]